MEVVFLGEASYGSASFVGLLMTPGWVVGVEVSHYDCVAVARKEVIEGVQVRYASMCESPVAAYDSAFLSIDGCGDGAYVVGVRVNLGGVCSF